MKKASAKDCVWPTTMPVSENLHKGVVTLSESQQRTLLSLALPQYEDDVRGVIRPPLTQNEFDALVSFDFAHGSGNLMKLKDKNKREISDIIRHFDDGRDAGLVKRRGQEADEFLLPDSGDIKSPDTVQ